jgi:type II secretory pathway pseudopilin PulG
MTMSKETRNPRGSAGAVLTAKRRQNGTSLVEILVVIVIFLIGILAVVQVFPRGFRILLTSRNNSVATALGRAEVERLKERPDLLPDQVLAVQYVGGTPVVNPTIDPLAFDPRGDTIDASGRLSSGGVTSATDWKLASGPNVARRIIGEGQRVPAPRKVGSDWGGLMVLEHGPIDPKGPMVIYGNDLSRSVGAPRESTQSSPPSGFAVGVPLPGGGQNDVSGVTLVTTPIATAPFEFFAADPSTTEAAILLPASSYKRTYRVRMSAYVGASGSYSRIDYVSLSVAVPPLAPNGPSLVRIRLDDLLAATPGALPPGSNLLSTDVDTIQVAPQYLPPATTGWSGDPFQVKVLGKDLGVLIFSPYAREGVVSRPGGVSEPLLARVDYDVLDWRILREEFRVVSDDTTFPLALQSIKVGTQAGPDGLPNGTISSLETPVRNATDNVVVVDLTTGSLVDESNDRVIVDKSRGFVTLKDADTSTPGIQVNLILPTGGTQFADVYNRTFRVLYRARNEWAVQLIKPTSNYAYTATLPPADKFYGQYFVGDGSSGLKWRIYFPRADINRKVTIDRLSYISLDGSVKTVEGQDFIIHGPRPNDTSNLPYIDIRTDLDGNAQRFVTPTDNAGDAVSGVKGASVSVRVLWNPDSFSLTNDGIENMKRVDVWARGWRKSMTETYLRTEETR